MKKIILVVAAIFSLNTAFAENWWEIDSQTLADNKKVTIIQTSEIKQTSEINRYDKYYLITFEISQSHYSLDISEHLKDSINKVTFQIPVDEDYYNKVKVGDIVSDKFRLGSLIMKGSFGKWKVKVIDKQTVLKK